MSKADIQHLLRPRVQKQSVSFRFFGIWIYILLPALTFVLGALNLVDYRSNATMQAVVAAMMVGSVGILVYGVYVARSFERILHPDDDLVTVLRRQLRFFRTRYEAWLWLAAAALVLLSLNVNFLMDNQDGHFPFHWSADFVFVTLAQFTLAYVFFKIGQYAIFREMRAVLSDLERQVTESTELYDRVFKRKWHRWMMIAAIIGTVLFLLGLVVALFVVR